MFQIYSEFLRPFTYQLLKFSGGEIQPKILSGPSSPDSVTIAGNITSSDDLMELLLLVDALRRRQKELDVNLLCPYLPYARQDRVCAPGESLALKVFASVINSVGFTSVTVWDVHSDVSLAVLDNAINVPQSALVTRIKWKDTVLVSPDAGANKKTLESSKLLGLPFVRADKTRSSIDGSITGTVVYSEHIGKQDFLIVDDICDGGRTFIELAKVLRPLTDGKIYLYVTHGIFSKGLDVFDGLIDGVYTVNPFPNVDVTHKLLTVI